jgi:hypothetical protein
MTPVPERAAVRGRRSVEDRQTFNLRVGSSILPAPTRDGALTRDRELSVWRLPQVEKRRAGPTEGDLGLLVRRPHEQVRDGRLKRPG